MTTLTVADLTQTTLDGTGVFDVLMRANAAHLKVEFDKGRLKGPEYSTVYLGSMQSAMSTAVAYLLQSRKMDLEMDLLTQQIATQTAQKLQIEAQTLLLTQQKTNLADDLTTNTAQRTKLAAELTLLTQKTTTEKAQVEAGVAVEDSVIGRQKLVYKGQADGYVRDAEQKTAQIMVQTWNTRMLSDSAATNYDAINKMADVYVGGAVSKLLTGVGVNVP